MYKDNSNKNFNKEPKKDWRKRTTHQPNGLPKNLRVEIPVSCYGITMDGKEYDGTTFIDLMENLQANDTFSKISIPSLSRSLRRSSIPSLFLVLLSRMVNVFASLVLILLKRMILKSNYIGRGYCLSLFLLSITYYFCVNPILT